jgi:hypothetical protein
MKFVEILKEKQVLSGHLVTYLLYSTMELAITVKLCSRVYVMHMVLITERVMIVRRCGGSYLQQA